MAWNTDIVLALFIPVYEEENSGRVGDGGEKSEGEALKRMIDETFTASKKTRS